MTKFQYTEEQKQAIDKMKKFLRGDFPGEFEFSLIGAAGTGKTTILKEVVKDYDPSLVFGATVSHAAKTVLNENAGDWMHCDTLASLLNLKPDVDSRGKRIFVPINRRDDAPGPPVSEAKVLIVDECSMVDDQLQEIIQETIMEGTYIIYSGDKYQLPPVLEGDEAPLDSPTFDCKLQAELTVPMRFDDIIGETAIFYRETINIFNQYGGINVDSFNNWMPVKSNGVSSIEFTRDYFYFMNKALQYFYYDRENTRMLAYRNKIIDELNEYIRKQFYPYHDDWYVPGEYIIMNQPYGKNIHNGEIFYISDVTVDKIDVPALEPKEKVKGHKVVKRKIMVYLLSVKKHYNSSEIETQLPVLHPDAEDTFREIKSYYIEVAKENRQWWQKYYNFMDHFANVAQTYLTSTHKAQGQSIDHVFVMANDILSTQKTSTKEKLQSLYVAVTRAKKNLTVLL